MVIKPDDCGTGRTLVVNRVSKPEDANDPPDERCRRRVLPIEVTRLEPAAGARSCGALWEFRIEVDKRRETGA